MRFFAGGRWREQHEVGIRGVLHVPVCILLSGKSSTILCSKVISCRARWGDVPRGDESCQVLSVLRGILRALEAAGNTNITGESRSGKHGF